MTPVAPLPGPARRLTCLPSALRRTSYFLLSQLSKFTIILYLLPTWLQFCAFSLWPVYFARITFPETHKACRPKLWYIIINTLLFALNVVVMTLTLTENNQTEELTLTRDLQSGFACVVYLLLCVLLIAFGYRFAKLTDREYKKTYLPQRPRVLIAVTIVLSILFLVRAVYDFLSTADIWELEGFPPVTIVTVAFFFVVDLLPASVCLVLTFGVTRGPKRDTLVLAGGSTTFAPLLARFQDVSVHSPHQDYVVNDAGDMFEADVALSVRSYDSS